MYKTIEVEVDISDFDDDDLIEVLENRGYTVNKTGYKFDEDERIEELYQAIKLGKPYYGLLRKYIMDRTGRIL
jgi:nucleoside diphosphate kinase